MGSRTFQDYSKKRPEENKQMKRTHAPKECIKRRLVSRMERVLGKVTHAECLRLIGLPTWEAVVTYLMTTCPDNTYWKDCDIDHNQCFATAETRDQLKMCCHYTNLQLLARDTHKNKTKREISGRVAYKGN